MLIRRRQRKQRDRQAAGWANGWELPAHFNFTRDVVEARGNDLTARALTSVDAEGIVDRRSFGEVACDAARWAHALRSRLPHPGEPVLVVAGTVPEAYLAMLGAIKGGLVLVPCPGDIRAAELAFRVRHARVPLVVAGRSAEPEITAMLELVDRPPDVLYLDAVATELRRYPTAAPTEDTAAGDRALLVYTAGTGAEPKAVVHTHAALWAARSAAERWLGARENDLVWTTPRLGWPEWIWHGLFGPWSVGAEVVVHDGPFDPERRLDLLQRLGVNILCQTPTEYRALVPAGATAAGALPKLREAVSTGEALEAALVESYRDGAGIALRDGLTQAECGFVAGTLAGSTPHPGVLGIGAPGHEVAVIDPDGRVVDAGEDGELAILGRPPTLFTGYLDAPEATAAVFREMWYLTGDRCTSVDGELRYEGRADDVIVSAGLRIGPAEVEAAVGSHPLVAEVAAVASPDAANGMVVKAFVTLVRGASTEIDLTETLTAHVTAVASPHLAPARVEVVEALPRTATGKLRRVELRALEEERHAATATATSVAIAAAAATTAAERARALAELEERHQAERQAARDRAEAERQRLLREAEELRRREEVEARAAAAAKARAATEAEARRVAGVERLAAEQALRAAQPRLVDDTTAPDDHESAWQPVHEAATPVEPVEDAKAHDREAARLAEEERKRAEREQREAAQLAEEERKHRERAEREEAARRDREERDAARRAEEERKQRDKAERDAATRREREAREGARRAEEEHRQRERAEREAAARQEREARDAARREEEERKHREKGARDQAARSAAQSRRRARVVSIPDPDDVPLPEHDAPIPGLADRIRRYADAPASTSEGERLDPVGSTDDEV